MPHNTFFAFSHPQRLASLRRSKFSGSGAGAGAELSGTSGRTRGHGLVLWVGRYEPEWKIHPSLASWIEALPESYTDIPSAREHTSIAVHDKADAHQSLRGGTRVEKIQPKREEELEDAQTMLSSLFEGPREPHHEPEHVRLNVRLIPSSLREAEQIRERWERTIPPSLRLLHGTDIDNSDLSLARISFSVPRERAMLVTVSCFTSDGSRKSCGGSVLRAVVGHVAAQPESVFITRAMELRFLNKYARWVTQTEEFFASGGQLDNGNTPYYSAGITGDGIVVGCSDTGIGECWFCQSLPVFCS